MQQLAFYPRFSTPDLHILRAPGPGLGNLLFPWARAVLLAERDGGRLINPTWRNIKLGPILRRESDLRTYGDLFHHRSPKSFFADLATKILHQDKISEEEYLRNPRPALVIIEGERGHFSDLFGAGSLLHAKLTQLVRNPPDRRRGGIAMHVRMGDFQETGEEVYSRNSRVALSWFVAEAGRLRKRLGDIPIKIFTDDTTGAARRAFSSVENLTFAAPGTAIQDILSIASAQHIVCSNSTFSLWGVFLSDATFSARFQELFADYEFDPVMVRERYLGND